jgi:hypothetical protein
MNTNTNTENIIYECIVCEKSQDTGIKNCKYCFLDCVIIEHERINKNQCPYFKVCDICFRKGKLIDDDFFSIKRSKEERRIYFNYKKMYKTKEDIHNYWNMISENIYKNG